MLNVKIDSRKVNKGDIFVAIKGCNVDGHDYVYDAIKNGARFVVLDHDMYLPASIGRIIISNTEKWLENYIVSHFKKEINDLNIIGITGTNGKTTSAFLTYQLLNKLGDKTSYIGTIGYYTPDYLKVDLLNTTPTIADLYDLLIDSKKKGINNVVMEVSSQGLDKNRTKGLEFKIASFTNLTQDHLDYHKTMENYLNAKLKILDQLNGPLIVNNDDLYSKIWLDKVNNSFTYGKNGDLSLININSENNEIEFLYKNKTYKVQTKLRGIYNIYNLFNAISIALNMGYDIDKILEYVPTLNPPKGRCETFNYNGGIVVVDYAHTPDAVKNIIDAFLINKKGRLITVIGCGGNRDSKKRPIMGDIATSKSDLVVFTNDNPRCEDPKNIMNDILSGVSKDNYEVIYDRKEAISSVVNNISEGDIVLILGKGHEDYQIIGNEKHHFDDSEIVKQIIDEKIKVRKIPH